jgi:hypothetical protein
MDLHVPFPCVKTDAATGKRPDGPSMCREESVAFGQFRNKQVSLGCSVWDTGTTGFRTRFGGLRHTLQLASW